MAYAIADILLFLLLLAGLWYVLFSLYRWFATRRERQESADIIHQIEAGLNKKKEKQ